MTRTGEHPGIELRRFEPENDDEQQMRDLVFANAFLGQPFSDICSCKDWFGEVVLKPYVEMEPDNIHVAVEKDSGRLVGYLTGSTRGEDFMDSQQQYVHNRVGQLAASTLLPWNFFDASRREFVAHLIQSGEKEMPEHPSHGAHWHFQVAADQRGRGIGAALYKRFQSDARERGHKLIWAEVMIYPEKPRSYFEDRGWRFHHVLPTGIFRNYVDFPVEIACIKKPLVEEVLH